MKKTNLLIFCMISEIMIAQVGINTNSPTATLDVNGEVRIRSLPTSSSTPNVMLTIDSNGNISKRTSPNLRKNTIGDIKYSRDTTDNNGWFILNGRAITSLPANAQVSASALGFSSNIPNFINKIEKSKIGTEVLGATGGSTSVSLTRNNLPTFSINGNTDSSGDHNHSLTQIQNSGSPGQGRAFSINNNGTPYGTASATRTLTTNGAHTHSSVTLNSNGGNQPINLVPAYLSLNAFVYLGN